jgi:hypothetical protein
VTGLSTRVKAWALALAVADALSWALTIHAHLTYHRGKNGPSVMPEGQLLGWSLSVLLLIALVLLLLGARADAKYRKDRQPPR